MKCEHTPEVFLGFVSLRSKIYSLLVLRFSLACLQLHSSRRETGVRVFSAFLLSPSPRKTTALPAKIAPNVQILRTSKNIYKYWRVSTHVQTRKRRVGEASRGQRGMPGETHAQARLERCEGGREGERTGRSGASRPNERRRKDKERRASAKRERERGKTRVRNVSGTRTRAGRTGSR